MVGSVSVLVTVPGVWLEEGKDRPGPETRKQNTESALERETSDSAGGTGLDEIPTRVSRRFEGNFLHVSAVEGMIDCVVE